MKIGKEFIIDGVIAAGTFAFAQIQKANAKKHEQETMDKLKQEVLEDLKKQMQTVE